MEIGYEVERIFNSELAGSAHPLAECPGITCFEANGHLRPLRAIEGDVIRLALEAYGWRLCQVSRDLRISRSTLYRKLDELGISQPRKKH